ncbi:MAG: murein hydrolase activator EnvC family protein [Gammaproteobacteria bacterium]
MCSLAYADTTPSVHVLEKKLETLNQSLKTDASNQDTLESTLKQIDVSIAQTSEVLRQSNAQIIQTQKALHVLNVEQTAAKNELFVQKSKLIAQVKATYLAGHIPFLKMLLNQQDPHDFSRMMTYYRYFNVEQHEKVKKVQAQLEAVAARETLIVKTLTDLKALQQTQLAQLNAKKSEQAERSNVLAALNQEIAKKGDQIKVIKADVAKLNSIVQSLRKPTPTNRAAQSLAEYRGDTRAWPVKGRLVHAFGAPSETASGRHNGVFLSAAEGSPVTAVHAGEVVYADWLRGYGWLLIVDHGDHDMSLYAYNQTLYKQVGDSVKPGDLLARVGKSGAKPDPGLYFELRRYGKAIDPLAWIKQQG